MRSEAEDRNLDDDTGQTDAHRGEVVEGPVLLLRELGRHERSGECAKAWKNTMSLVTTSKEGLHAP